MKCPSLRDFSVINKTKQNTLPHRFVKFTQMIKQVDEFLLFKIHFGGGVFEGR
jgi:hypothetical protein